MAPMAQIDNLEEILELMRSGLHLEGPLDSMALGREFKLCREGLPTDLSVNPIVALELIGHKDIDMTETDNMLILRIAP